MICQANANPLMSVVIHAVNISLLDLLRTLMQNLSCCWNCSAPATSKLRANISTGPQQQQHHIKGANIRDAFAASGLITCVIRLIDTYAKDPGSFSPRVCAGACVCVSFCVSGEDKRMSHQCWAAVTFCLFKVRWGTLFSFYFRYISHWACLCW